MTSELTTDELLSTINHSHKANELELAMSHVFKQLIAESELARLNDIFAYGVAWNGSRTVVERFSKLHGLVVLRRDDGGLSDKLMKIILSNWIALASERGLGFLQFVLDMLYPQQNEIIRLWHSKALANNYPDYISEHENNDRFLTSRIRIKFDTQVDVKELSELVPTLARLVPAHIVPEIAVGFDTEIQQIGVATVLERFHVADFTNHELLSKKKYKHDRKIRHNGQYRYNNLLEF